MLILRHILAHALSDLAAQILSPDAERNNSRLQKGVAKLTMAIDKCMPLLPSCGLYLSLSVSCLAWTRALCGVVSSFDARLRASAARYARWPPLPLPICSSTPSHAAFFPACGVQLSICSALNHSLCPTAVDGAAYTLGSRVTGVCIIFALYTGLRNGVDVSALLKSYGFTGTSYHSHTCNTSGFASLS